MNNQRFIRITTQNFGQKITGISKFFRIFFNYSYLKAIVSNFKNFRHLCYASDFLFVVGKNNFDDFVLF